MSCVQKAAASFCLDFKFIAYKCNHLILLPYLPQGNSDQGSKKSCPEKTKCLNQICLGKMTSKPALTMFSSLALNYCWFVHDVAVATLVVRTNTFLSSGN